MVDASMVASLEAHVLQLKNAVKTLTQERQKLLELRKHNSFQDEIDVLLERKKTLEQYIQGLEEKISSSQSLIDQHDHQASLLRNEIKGLSSEITQLLHQKKGIIESISALDSKLMLLRDKDSHYLVLEDNIKKLIHASKEKGEELVKIQAEIAEHHRKMREDMKVIMAEKSSLAKERKKVDDYYSKVKSMEDAVHEREENVLRQELMQRGRNIPAIIKKFNGKL